MRRPSSARVRATTMVVAAVGAGLVAVAGPAMAATTGYALTGTVGPGTVSVLDATRNGVTATVGVGQWPYGVVVDPSTHRRSSPTTSVTRSRWSARPTAPR